MIPDRRLPFWERPTVRGAAIAAMVVLFIFVRTAGPRVFEDGANAHWYWIAVALIVAIHLGVIAFALVRMRRSQSEEDRARRRPVMVAGSVWQVASGAVIALNFTTPRRVVATECGPSTRRPFQLCVTQEEVLVGLGRQVLLVSLLAVIVASGALAWRRWRSAFLDRPDLSDQWWERQSTHRIVVPFVALMVAVSFGQMEGSTSSEHERYEEECSTSRVGDTIFIDCPFEWVEVSRVERVGSDVADTLAPVAVLLTVAAVAWWMYVASAEFLARRTAPELVWRRALMQWWGDRHGRRAEHEKAMKGALRFDERDW